VQGNIDPEWLLLPPHELEGLVRGVFKRVQALPEAALAAWVCGLGTGCCSRPRKIMYDWY